MDSAFGISSRNMPSRLGPRSPVTMLTPVAFPPGLLILETNPIFTGSLPTEKMIGVVEVALFAASAEVAPPIATSTFTF